MRRSRLSAAAVLSLAFLCFGCDYATVGYDGAPWLVDDVYVIGPPYGVEPDLPGGAPVLVSVNGVVSFDRYPIGPGGAQDTPVATPAAFIVVEAVSAEDYTQVIRTTTTDAAGSYSMTFTCTMDYFVRARAQTGSGADLDRVIHPGTRSKVVHAITSYVQHRAAGGGTLDLHANRPSGDAGAFSVLDTIRRLRASVSATFPALGPLDVFWSRHNYWDGRYIDEGLVAGTFTTLDGPKGNPTIFLMGGNFRPPHAYEHPETDFVDDHDEDDETVIAHEWASFLQLTQSRDNNFGGTHAGEELLYTASYSEGVVTAIGCALLDQRLYRDSVFRYPDGPELQFEFDLESGILPGTGTGYGSEFVTTRVVWDLLDGGLTGPDDFDGDGISVAMPDFLASFNRLRTRAAPYEVCWLASLLQQLVDDNQLTVGQADALMSPHGETFPPAGGPDPFPAELQLGTPQTGTLNAYATADANPVLGPDANGVFRLTLAAPATVTFTLDATNASYAAASHRLELSVHALDREILGLQQGDNASKALTLNLPAGTFLVRVQHSPASATTSQDSAFTLSAQ